MNVIKGADMVKKADYLRFIMTKLHIPHINGKKQINFRGNL